MDNDKIVGFVRLGKYNTFGYNKLFIRNNDICICNGAAYIEQQSFNTCSENSNLYIPVEEILPYPYLNINDISNSTTKQS